MPYSSITPKKKQCNCGCGKEGYLWADGKLKYCYLKSKAKPRTLIKRKALKRKPVVFEMDLSLEQWFLDRRQEMTGFCKHCGGKSCKDSDKYYKFSACHILPKAYFPSVATNKFNCIELCFWENSCHTQMDNKMLDLSDMNCFDEIVVKFQKMYPQIAPNERRRIPNILLQYLGTDT